MRDDEEKVEFRTRIKRETELAFLCYIDGDEHWIPKSQVDLDASDVSEEGDIGTIVMSRWIAVQKGLV